MRWSNTRFSLSHINLLKLVNLFITVQFPSLRSNRSSSPITRLSSLIKLQTCQEAKYKLFEPPDIVWSMTLMLDVCQVTLPKKAALAIFSPKSTRATLHLAFPVSLIQPPNPPGPRLASISSRSCALLDYKGVSPGLDGFPLAWPGDSVSKTTLHDRNWTGPRNYSGRVICNTSKDCKVNYSIFKSFNVTY